MPLSARDRFWTGAFDWRPITLWSAAGTDRKVPLFERRRPTLKGQSSRELEEEAGPVGLKLVYAFQFVGASKLHQVFVPTFPLNPIRGLTKKSICVSGSGMSTSSHFQPARPRQRLLTVSITILART